jgi:N-acetylneuraminic acid mutarotase/predicted Ser/Thr protein kinase
MGSGGATEAMTERFTLLSELGRGGMGVVWKARNEDTGQIVALKLMRDAFTDDPSYRRRFEHEIAIARRITSAHVVKVLGYGSREGTPFIAFEFVDGPSIGKLLEKHGRYAWPEVRGLLLQLAEGLADAHAAGVIHRDIKPSNVLVDSLGNVKIADFGISRALDLTRVTRSSGFMGTPAYVAPEGPLDARSDLYSLGIIAYELLTGGRPFEGQTYQEVLVAHLSKPPDLSRLPEDSRKVVSWLLAKDPAGRPQSARELIRVLVGEDILPANPGSATSKPYPRSAPVYQGGGGRLFGRANRRTTVVAAGVIGVIVVVSVLLAPSAFLGSVTAPQATPTKVPPVAPSGSASFAAETAADPTATGRPTELPVQPAEATPAPGAKNAWTFSDPLPQVEGGSAGVVLADGRFIVIGGTVNGSSTRAATAAVWILDPASAHWSAGPSLNQARAYAMAVRLTDGSILVAGGSSNSKPMATAERLYPGSGSWVMVGQMSEARTEGSMVALLSGAALAVGGGTVGAPSYKATASADVFDPTSNQWTAALPMSSARAIETATVLNDGRVLVAGGATVWYSQAGQVNSSAEIFDPATGQWTPTAPMPTALYTQQGALLNNGQVLIAGGFSSTANSAAAVGVSLLFDPTTGQWRQTAPLTSSRAQHTMVRLADGRVLALGGVSGYPYRLVRSTEIFDPSTQSWSPAADLPVAIFWPATGVLQNGTVVVAGGISKVGGGSATDICALFAP